MENEGVNTVIKLLIFIFVIFISCVEGTIRKNDKTKIINNEICIDDYNQLISMDTIYQRCFLPKLIDEICFEEKPPNILGIRLITYDDLNPEKVISIIQNPSGCIYYTIKTIPSPQYNEHFYLVENNKQINFTCSKIQLDSLNLMDLIDKINKAFTQDIIRDSKVYYSIETIKESVSTHVIICNSLSPVQDEIWRQLNEFRMHSISFPK